MQPRIEDRSVRDRRVCYGRPTPAEQFPGELVLEDLRHAPEAEIPAILARFAVVRAARFQNLDAPEHGHAVHAARAHLEALGSAWPEGCRLLQFVEGSAGSGCLERAAREAAASGHAAGARALRQEAHRIRWARLGLPPLWPS